MISDSPLDASGFSMTSQIGGSTSHMDNIFPSLGSSASIIFQQQQQQNKNVSFDRGIQSNSSSVATLMSSHYSPLITASTSHHMKQELRDQHALPSTIMDTPTLKSSKFQLKINIQSKSSMSTLSNMDTDISTAITPSSFTFHERYDEKRYHRDRDNSSSSSSSVGNSNNDNIKAEHDEYADFSCSIYSPLLFLKVNQQSNRSILSEREYNEAFAEGRIIGTGSDSIVKEVMYRRTGEKMACKIIPKNSSSLRVKNLEQDIKVLMAIRHPNIISLKKVYETSTDFKFVMELASGGDLYEKIIEKERYFEPETCQVMLGILSAVAYLHDQGIIHRDIKPENFLLASKDSETYVKLADFGTAKITFHENNNEYNAADFMDVDGRESFDAFDDSKVSSSYSSSSSSSSSSASRTRAFSGVGSLTVCENSNYYVAPEILLGDGYDKQVDMWSIGVVMYVLLCGSPPFHEGDDDDEHKSYKNIIQGKFSFSDPCWASVSDLAKDLIQRLLTVDPEKRLTANQALNHPWILSYISLQSSPNAILQNNNGILQMMNVVRKCE